MDEDVPPVSSQAGSSATIVAPPGHEIESDPARSPGSPAPLVEEAPSDPSAAGALAGKTVWVVDANSLIFQVFHAIPEMTSPRGQPVNAVYGFARDMFFLLEDKRPDYLFVAFDPPGKTFRDELFADYKKTRSEMPADLVPQFPLIERLLTGMGIPILLCPSFEADDVLATLARLSDEAGAECFLVSGDKDCRQLITPRVKVYNVRKDQVFDDAALVQEWGIRPDQVVDFQALVGDAVDNVPGVPLIGPKNARDLLEKYGTLDEVLARAGEVSGAKRRQNLLAFGDQARLSRQLVRLDSRVPLAVDWAAGRAGRIDRPALLALFVELGFRSLAAKMRSTDRAEDDRADALAPPPSESEALLAETPLAPPGQPAATAPADAAPPPPPVPIDYRLVATAEELASLVAEMRCQPRISIDTETTHIWPTWADLVGFSCSWQPGQAWYVPLRAPPGEPHVDPQTGLELLRLVLEDPAVEKVGQNLKYDLIVLGRAGVAVRGLAFDTMIASYLIDAGQRNHNLDELALRLLNHTTTKIAELIGTGRQQKRMDEVPLAQICHYAAEDADVAMRLQPLLADRLAAADLTRLLATLEMPLVEVLVELESNGVRIDVARLQELSVEYGRRIAAIERDIYDLAGREFNIASPKQLQQVLFVEQKLPTGKRTQTGPSTDADVLEDLARKHPLPAKILEYRQYAKLKGTYIDALPEMVNPLTGRVHPSFNQVVAATGRLSCNDPNLQNIPVRTDHGREIRSAFLPGQAGWSLIAADYSQIELRVLAHFSGDRSLCEAFARDDDIHALVAAQVNGVPLDGVTKEMRRQAKAVNFGVVYGQSAFGLARQLGIEQDAAQAFIDAYFRRYEGVERFLTKVLAECRASGYVSTILGRRRAITGVRAETGRGRNLPERTAINTVIQGSAADLIKLSMIAVFRRLKREKLAARMLLQVHDELIFEAPPEEVTAVARLAKEEMSSVMALAVPLKVDVSVGPTWADLAPLADPPPFAPSPSAPIDPMPA
jgi:DNA polymerase-1